MARHSRHIELALQGGGRYGAFTWGVLDRLLEDESIVIDGISGTSAGAMNAVVVANGLAAGADGRGHLEAREGLRRFWTRVANASLPAAPAATPFGLLFGTLGFAQLAEAAGSALSQILSPYQLNPLDINPLRDILASEVDFERVRAYEPLQLFVAATHVPTGQMREFRRHELTADVIMASACLPMLFRAVEIDGEPYWDGGYVGNPSLLPLIRESPADDLVLVQINPAQRAGLPRGPREIAERLDEITFNASLLKELRAIALLKQAILDEGRAPDSWKAPLVRAVSRLRLHRICADCAVDHAGDGALSIGSHFTELHRHGREAASRWLDDNYAHLGRRSTLNVLKMHLVAPLPKKANGNGRARTASRGGNHANHPGR
jgi:NTE family protein